VPPHIGPADTLAEEPEAVHAADRLPARLCHLDEERLGEQSLPEADEVADR